MTHLTNTDAAAIAAFIARRGVTRIPTGAAALDLTDRQWAAAVRGNLDLRSERAERLSERRHEVGRDAARMGDRAFAADVAGGRYDRELMGE